MSSFSPRVAVFMITFRHVNYIDEAIKSVVSQETNFPFLLVIGDDCSDDGTLEKCISWKNKYPELIKVLQREKNIGPQANARETYKVCLESAAEYIAILEGDDFWSDNQKLQKQVDLLDSNPDATGSYHNTNILRDDGSKKIMRNTLPKEIYVEDLIQKFSCFHTSSFVFRARFFTWPKWFSDVDSVDLAFFSWIASFGKLLGLAEEMSTYRVHNFGMTASVSHRENFDTRRIVLHRMMRGRVPHSSFDKYQELIDFHSSKTDDSWKTIIPNCTAFYESEENAMDMAIRKFKMNLLDEVVNFRILDDRLYVMNRKISLLKYSKFLNRLIWNKCFSSYIGRKPSAIIFTSQSSIDSFINYFGRMNINAHFHFNVDSLSLEKYKNNFREIYCSDSE
jgi:glycosyltransferase involved in cell wall biosynthesis